ESTGVDWKATQDKLKGCSRGAAVGVRPEPHRLTESLSGGDLENTTSGAGTSAWPCSMVIAPEKGSSMRRGRAVGAAMRIENSSGAFCQKHSIEPWGVGTRPCAQARLPGCGAMRMS